MNTAELDSLLAQYLTDRKLSGSERDALAAWAEKNIATEQQRGAARSRAFEAARKMAGDPAVIDFLESVLKVLVPVAGAAEVHASSTAAFSPGDGCLGLIVNHFHALRATVDICVFTITDNRISDAILAAQRRGVKIRIITDDEKAYDPGSDVPRFRDAGIPVVVDHSPFHMHHKFAIFDGRRLVNGSYNWTRSAAEQNQENVIDTDDRVLIAKFQAEFEKLWVSLPA